MRSTQHSQAQQALVRLGVVQLALRAVADLGRFDTAYDDVEQHVCALLSLFAGQLDEIYVQLSNSLRTDEEETP
jgi:hypothetical protein